MGHEKKLLIVSHTPSVNTQTLTDSVAEGARSSSAIVELSPPLETGPEQVLAADGIILGTTENFGYMSLFIHCFDTHYIPPCLEETRGLPYAIFIRAGQDGLGARSSIERIVTGLGWRAVQEPLICKGPVSDFRDDCRQLGALMALGLEQEIF